MSYSSYTKYNNLYLANSKRREVKKLPSGSYEIKFSRETGQLFFKEMSIHHDDIVELPSKEYQLVTNQIEHFMKPETREAFKEYGFLYKRSMLMHGLHGTGKTILADRISNFVIDKGGVVLFNPDPSVLSIAFDSLTSTQPETTVAVVFEELDQLVKRHEDDLLHLLDGEVQRENVIYLATTNFIDKIPARIMRPGRFSNVIEVKFPDANVRKAYLSAKLNKSIASKEVKEWSAETKGLSIDEVKETVLSVKCLGYGLKEVVQRIKDTKELSLHDPIYKNKKDEYFFENTSHIEAYEVRDLIKGKK